MCVCVVCVFMCIQTQRIQCLCTRLRKNQIIRIFFFLALFTLFFNVYFLTIALMYSTQKLLPHRYYTLH